MREATVVPLEGCKQRNETMDVDGLMLLRSILAIAALAVALVLQRWRPHSRSPGSPRLNFALFVLGTAATAAVCGACGFEAAIRVQEAGVGILSLVVLPPGLETLIAIGGLDLASYAWHRANHAMPFLWRFHRVHHSDPSFTVSTGLRFHPGELLLSLPVRLAAIALVGATPWQVLVYEGWFATANLVEHGDISLPRTWERRFGSVVVLPAHHRRHHSRVPAELNRNFGTIFILWDRWLGTLLPAGSADRVEVGLPGGEYCDEIGRALWMPLEARSRRSAGAG